MEYRNRHREVRELTKECDVVLAGDSRIKFIDGRRLSRRKKVQCIPHLGAKIEDVSPDNICQNVKPGGQVVFHIGGNNSQEGASRVHAMLVALGDNATARGHDDRDNVWHHPSTMGDYG